MASGLNNSSLPSIVVVPASCSTAWFAEEGKYIYPPTIPYLGADKTSMAEAFLTHSENGGVIYIGSVTGTRSVTQYMGEVFLQAIEDGTEHVGDAYRQAIEAYIIEHDSDNFTQSRRIQLEDDYPDPDKRGWNSNDLWERLLALLFIQCIFSVIHHCASTG